MPIQRWFDLVYGGVFAVQAGFMRFDPKTQL